jgi:transposase
MRGDDERTGSLFSYVNIEKRVAKGHPIRKIRDLVNAALAELDKDFAGLYAPLGRPSIAPEKLIRAMMLQMLYSVRSERALMERLDFDLLFRWFVGFGVDDKVWDASTFSKNRERLLTTDTAQAFLSALLGQAEVKRLLSNEHFSVDGTMLKAWASMKSFVSKNPPPHDPPSDGKRSNDSHASTTDDEARLYRKGNGKESHLAYLGHALMENRNGLAVGGVVTQATGKAEREAALELCKDLKQEATLGADKGYDAEGFVEALKAKRIVPHIAIQGHVGKCGKARKTAVPDAVAKSEGYAVSQRKRKRIEEIFGWMKTTAGLHQLKVRGLKRVKATFGFAIVAYNLIRLPKLLKPMPEVCLPARS